MNDNLVKLANFKLLEWNSGISSFLPLNQFVMSVLSKHFRLSFNVLAIIDTEPYLHYISLIPLLVAPGSDSMTIKP